MKKSVILRIEDENGIQEFPVQVSKWERLMEVLFEENCGKVSAKTLKEMMRTCNDHSVVAGSICYYFGRITLEEATAVMERFPKSKKIQHALIAYAVMNGCKLEIIEKIAENPLDAEIRKEVTDILDYHKK